MCGEEKKSRAKDFISYQRNETNEVKLNKEVEWQKFLYFSTFYAFLWLDQNSLNKHIQGNYRLSNTSQNRKKEVFIHSNMSY